MKPKLRAKLAVKARRNSHEPFHATFELTNKGTTDVYILPWDTPLEGLHSDCLEIVRDGEHVPYDGPLVKRAPPTKDHYIKVRAGQTIKKEIDLSSAYQVSMPGKYEVKVKGLIKDVGTRTEVNALAKAKVAARKHRPDELKVLARKFQTRVGKHFRATQGEMARRLQEDAPPPPSPKAAKKKSAKKKAGKKQAKAKAPTLVGGTASQRTAAAKAFTNGYNLTLGALSDLKNNAQYTEWFGTYSTTRLNKVKANYTAVRKGMEKSTFTYNLTGQGCQASWYAYTYKGTTTIWFCGGFWSAPATGTDSKAGTVVHEHSHASADTDDIAYGQSSCRALAKNKPNDAVRNADNHEYYAGG